MVGAMIIIHIIRITMINIRTMELCRSWFYTFARALAVVQELKGEGVPRDQQLHLFSRLYYIFKKCVI